MEFEYEGADGEMYKDVWVATKQAIPIMALRKKFQTTAIMLGLDDENSQNSFKETCYNLYYSKKLNDVLIINFTFMVNRTKSSCYANFTLSKLNKFDSSKVIYSSRIEELSLYHLSTNKLIVDFINHAKIIKKGIHPHEND